MSRIYCNCEYGSGWSILTSSTIVIFSNFCSRVPINADSCTKSSEDMFLIQRDNFRMLQNGVTNSKNYKLTVNNIHSNIVTLSISSLEILDCGKKCFRPRRVYGKKNTGCYTGYRSRSTSERIRN
uniref:Uncharacterized protein n=1 Tax=Rhizophagus irregularis (strain DAOM 181602 / DAOM 197198 / MUCL 43194) TaxID=747089 RepID=U9U6K0_RHIID